MSGFKKRMSKKHGFSLVEMALVLGIVGLVLGAIWTAAGSASERQKEGHAANELQQITQGVLSYLQNRSFSSPYGNILTNMIGSGVVPQEAIVQGAPQTAINPWGGAISIYSESATTYRVSFFDVPESGCIALILQATNCTQGAGCPFQVGTNGNAVTPPTPLTVVTATSLGGQWNFTPTAVDTSLCSYNNGAAQSIVAFDYSITN